MKSAIRVQILFQIDVVARNRADGTSEQLLWHCGMNLEKFWGWRKLFLSILSKHATIARRRNKTSQKKKLFTMGRWFQDCMYSTHGSLNSGKAIHALSFFVGVWISRTQPLKMTPDAGILVSQQNYADLDFSRFFRIFPAFSQGFLHQMERIL